MLNLTASASVATRWTFLTVNPNPLFSLQLFLSLVNLKERPGGRPHLEQPGKRLDNQCVHCFEADLLDFLAISGASC